MPGSTTETAGASEEMSEEGVSLSRRKLFTAFRNCAASTESFKSIGTALAATHAAGSASNSAQAAPRSVSADVDKNALLAKLVHRLTWGFTQAEYALMMLPTVVTSASQPLYSSLAL